MLGVILFDEFFYEDLNVSLLGEDGGCVKKMIYDLLLFSVAEVNVLLFSLGLIVANHYKSYTSTNCLWIVLKQLSNVNLSSILTMVGRGMASSSFSFDNSISNRRAH